MTSVFIKGRWIEGEGSFLESTSPTDNRLLWRKKGASENQVSQTVAAARQAQAAWADKDLDTRFGIVEPFAQLLQQQQPTLARLISEETGKPLWESTAEVSAMIKKIDISRRALEDRAGQHSEEGRRLCHRPHGVLAVYGPYNFPGHLPNGHIVPAILAGNSVIFKPSELTPAVAEFYVNLWAQTDLPKGVIHMLQGGPAIGQALAKAPIDGLLFTGSSKTGKILHRALADRPQCLLALEMGGNNPLIVADFSNIDVAVWHIIQSAFVSAGQRCTCANRLIIVESNQTQPLLDKLIDSLDKLIVGPWDSDPEPFMGPVINRDAATQILQSQSQHQQRGGKPLATTQRLPNGDSFLSPGIVDLTGIQDVPDEELFGPLLQLYRVDDFESAIALANQTRFGLAAGLISDDSEQQQRFAKQIKAGVISVNKPMTGASSELPFGGIGDSGNHRPSAYYAADYCAWPQSQTWGSPTGEQAPVVPKGTRE